jgi:tetratricopeptide (TPR) repeat protein
MYRKKSLSRLFASLVTLIIFSAFVTSAVGFGQDPTGQPTGSSKGGGKKPPKKPSGPPAKPDPFTVTLTVFTDPPEASVYINGEPRGVTNGEGKIQFEKLALGSYSIEARKDGYVSAIRGFQAGPEAPTLVFKLLPDVSGYIKQFDELVATGKIAGPESPNALEVVNDLAGKYPDRPELARMRGTLATKLIEANTQIVNKTIFSWRVITRDEIARGLENATTAQTIKNDDNRIQAQALYFKGVLGLRDWLAGSTSSNGEGTNDAEALKTAKNDLEKATEADPSWAPVWYQLGVAQLNFGNGPGAETAFIKTTTLEPRWAVAYERLGTAYYILGKYKESIDAYRKAIQLDSGLAAAYAGLGLARTMKGERDGIKDVEKALQLDPKSGLPHLNIGIILSQPKRTQKEMARAAEELKTAIQKNSGNLEFQNRVAEQLLAGLQTPKK